MKEIAHWFTVLRKYRKKFAEHEIFENFADTRNAEV